jgi:hypothetical protein
MSLDETGKTSVFDSSGQQKVQSPGQGIAGRPFVYNKVATAKDAALYPVMNWKDGGIPGSWAIQDPGNLTGYTTDCGVASSTSSPLGAAQMGAHFFSDAGSGQLYLSAANIASNQAEAITIIDVLGYVNCDSNNGAAASNCLTNLGAQTISLSTPARDVNGSTNGHGVGIALVAGTALGNGSAITNTTVGYTDQDGNASTATLQAVAGFQMPASPVVGTFIPMTLGTGDNGVRAVDTLTNGTSYVSGNLLVVLYRVLATLSNLSVMAGAANFGAAFFEAPGIRVFDGTCISTFENANATTAGTLWGSYTILER